MASTTQHPPTRDTILLEDATILSNQACPGGQYIMRLDVPAIAEVSLPGQFVHLRCDTALPMRRPMSIMRAREGVIEVLYKVHGEGTRRLAGRQVGETLSVLGPIGKPFRLDGYRRRPLLIGGGVGIPPIIYLAEHMHTRHRGVTPFVIAGSEVPFPFQPVPSRIMVPGLDDSVIATIPLLEDWHIPCRLASLQGYPGCHEGYVTDLARIWLDRTVAAELEEVEIYSCGPTPMLRAVAALAQEYGLPCQVSLEEFMACAVGGCAGCTVEVLTPSGPAMKRVCVDGPVFEAADVYPAGNAAPR